MEKESKPFYHSTAWKKVRAQVILRDKGMCRDCMERFDAGISRHPRRATMVHHIQPLEERPDLALDMDNLVALCDACHNRRHPEKGRGETEEPPAPRMRIIKV